MNIIPALKPFDPESGEVIIEPLGDGEGYWVGACSVVFDPDDSTYYLYYRAREPRPIRGGKCFVAQSKDGREFETIWQTDKDALNTDSIEKGSLIKTPEGNWRLYLSYVDPTDQRWRIDLLEADHPSRFDIAKRTPILTAQQTSCEGVKDPFVMRVDDTYHMLVSYAPETSKQARKKKKPCMPPPISTIQDFQSRLRGWQPVRMVSILIGMETFSNPARISGIAMQHGLGPSRPCHRSMWDSTMEAQAIWKIMKKKRGLPSAST